MKIKFKPITLLACSLLFALECIANNGQRADAYPVEDIVIDGNLADWPADIVRYPILISQNRFSPINDEDFSAYFIVGYNLKMKSLYIGVEVSDESYIIDEDINATHLNQDAHLLYLDAQHSMRGSGVAMFALTKNSLRLVNNHLSWDPIINNASINGIEHAVAQKNDTMIYEWKIYLGDLLELNSTIGLDHVIVDMDKEDQKGEYSTMAWGSNGWKSSMQNNLGDVFILDPENQQGTIKGAIGWEAKSITSKIWGIQFISMENQRQWTQLPLRGKPDFKISLPPGNYKVKVALPSTVDSLGQFVKTHQLYERLITVKAGQTIEISNIVFSTIPPPVFHSMEKGLLLDFSNERTKELDSAIEKVMNYYNIPGMSLACIKDDKVVYLKNYGVQNLYTEKKVTDETLFDVGSVTKTIFVLTVLRLVEDGIIDLDSPLYEYLPYKDLQHDARYKKLTTRHVLSHQTGLPNWRNGQLNFINDPGVKFGYSGEGFQYLKLVVEKLTEEGIEITMRRLIIEPFGIQDAYFTSNPDLLKKLSFGYYDLNAQIHAPESKTYVAFGMHSNAKNFAPYLIGLLNQDVLNPSTYEKMLSKQIDIPADWPYKGAGWEQGYGLGFQLKYSPYGLVFGHGGRNGGFDCNFELYKDLNIGYVFFTNSSSGHLIKKLMREFLITGIDGN